MKMRTMCKAFLAAAAMALVAVQSGCNDGGDDPDTSQLDNYFATHPYVSDPRVSGPSGVDVSPDSASINTIGGQQLFQVTGGSGGYTWDISNASMGKIQPTGENQAIYTALAIGDNDVIVYDSQGSAAFAKINGTPPEGMTITANPDTIEVDNGLSVLTVEGGTPDYTWQVTDPALGSFPQGNTGTSVMYQRVRAGDCGVTVTDGLGSKANIVIKQP